VAENAVNLLQRVPIFEGLDKRELERIAASMKPRTFKPGEKVTVEGQGGVGFFVIESGEAKVTIGGDDRRHLGRARLAAFVDPPPDRLDRRVGRLDRIEVHVPAAGREPLSDLAEPTNHGPRRSRPIRNFAATG